MTTKSRYRLGSGTNGTPDLIDQIVALTKRVTALERAPTAAFTSIGRNGLDILDGGSVRIHDSNDNVVLQLGALASGGFGLETIDPATGDTVDLNALTFGAVSNTVMATESTTNTGWVDLTTHGPEVSVTIGPSGRALVTLGVYIICLAGGGAFMGFAISGATTLAAGFPNVWNLGIASAFAGDLEGQFGSTFLVTGLSPGVNTFTAKYNSVTGTSVSFGQYRNITVQPF